MSKLIGAFIVVLIIGVLAVGITNLVFTIKVFDKQKDLANTNENKNSRFPKRADGKTSTSKGFEEAANQLLRGLDLTVDPCDDFYAFTCNKYLKDAVIPDGEGRIGTYDEAQEKVFDLISQIIESMDDSKASLTEKITKNIYNRCLENHKKNETDKSKIIYDQIKKDLNDIPMFNDNWSPVSLKDVLTVAGRWEGQREISTLFDAYVTANDGNPVKPALYLTKPDFALPVDYYIKPQFLGELDDYRAFLVDLFVNFAKNVGKTGKDLEAKIETEVEKIVQFQVQLALNFIPNDLLKNALLQYNNYTTDSFAQAYPSIGSGFFDELFKVVTDDPSKAKTFDLIITEPRYYRGLDGMLQDPGFDVKVLVNFMAMQYLINHDSFIGGVTRDITKQINSKKFVLRKSEYDEVKLGCVGSAQAWMPYGTGYIYIANMTDKERNDIVADVTTQVNYVIQEFLGNVDNLKWMTKDGRQSVHKKADGLIKNIAYPYWFEFNSTAKLDAYHKNYNGLETVTEYFDVLEKLSVAHQKTENLGRLLGSVDRQNFQDSPATVNAWYEPTLNSITIPRAALNEPYYRLDFPQAYNYAGNGGTIGHEFTHGFDSDGVQYAGEGELAPCNYQFCTILDTNSSSGFLDMAQCVISQYNEQCCPLKTGSIHCTNGVNTQGENIADIGGQYAAYKAYRTWIKKNNDGKEEDLLPKMEQFNGNQIFWITYGFSWCMKQKDDSLAHQLLTNEHAPGSCRVNQVMQDLPEFATDFNCDDKSKLKPKETCPVWR